MTGQPDSELHPAIADESQLAALAHALGAARVPGLSPAEKALGGDRMIARALARRVRDQIAIGGDPLGVIFCRLRSPATRRQQGAVYTPLPIVQSMLDWARNSGPVDRVVDPGSGSGRFILAAGRAFPAARLVAVEADPLAALLTRANLAVTGLADRASVIVADYRRAPILDHDGGTTLFIGNPPYVRHHQLTPRDKKWLATTAARYGQKASLLAGLHVHFFLATLDHARSGDRGAFITAAEWLDVNYGALLRNLFLDRLGGCALHLIEPAARPFPDAVTTAAITCFHIDSRPPAIRVCTIDRPDQLGALERGRKIERARFTTTSRWSPLARGRRRRPRGFVELGELCRVSRGQVTGANKFWIAGPHARDLPASILFPTVTRAREIYQAGACLTDSSRLRQVIDLPADLAEIPEADRVAVDIFLREGKRLGVHLGYIARHRKAWWSVGLHEPAPILATYMARRPPGFVRNSSQARHINIAHGIYPREDMTARMLDALVQHLATSTSVVDGRTYAGGLTKFEPREMERLLVPGLDALRIA